jgi:hypothetical protein
VTWTLKPPATPGWFWYRLDANSEHFPLKLKKRWIEGEAEGHIITGTGKQVETMKGEWSSQPIQQPA